MLLKHFPFEWVRVLAFGNEVKLLNFRLYVSRSDIDNQVNPNYCSKYLNNICFRDTYRLWDRPILGLN